ncbi:MAG: DNA cytosine methyltransferase [Pseudorhodoferax sp.]
MRSVELFAGCGGLALGLSRAGFRHELVVELDEHAVGTLSDNKKRAVRACTPLADRGERCA